jgi:DNA-binding response OmpR family regulator
MDMQALVVFAGNSDERAALVNCLRQGGYDTVEVDSVQQARQALQDHQFALLFLDLGLPGASGLQLCSEIRGRLGPEMVIFLVGGDGRPYNWRVGLELGADDVVRTPFDADELLARIEAKLRRRHTIARC